MTTPEQIGRAGFDSFDRLEAKGLNLGVIGIEQEQASIPEAFQAESLPSPEKLRLKLKKVAVISGPSFSGKDSVVQILADRHGWSTYDGTIDDFKRRGKGPGTPIERERRAHIEFDNKQAKRFAELKPNDGMWIHQTRLGGIILASEIDKRNAELGRQNWKIQDGEMPENPVKPIPAVAILLWTSAKVREERAVEHERKLAREEGRPEPTRKHILADMRRKQLDDTRSWRRRFGSINFGSNPFSRYLKRKNDQPVYNRFVITDHKTVEEIADNIEKLLIQLGAAEYISPAPQNDGADAETEVSITLEPNTEIDLSRSNGEPIAKDFHHPNPHHPSNVNRLDTDEETVA